MNLGQTYNVNDLPQNDGNFEPIPSGDYQATIASAELKPTKDQTGQYINIRYDILGPQFQGRVIFGMINIANKSQKAEEIGRSQLGSLCRAIGLASISDTDQLIGANLTISVGIQPAKDGYEARNTVKKWKALSGGQMPIAPAASAPVANGGGTPPWAK